MLPHDSLERCFAEVEVAVPQLPAYTESYVEEILTVERANLRIRLRFENGALLEISEAFIVENDALKTLWYRYRLQSADNELVFRYDNTPHFPDLPSFPHTNIYAMPLLLQASLTCWMCCKRRKPTDCRLPIDARCGQIEVMGLETQATKSIRLRYF